jgi:hypothetical protein
MTATAATKQMAKISETSGAEAAPEQSARSAPLLKPDTLTWNSEGYVWREARVLLPNTAILQDLNDPAIWRPIQSTPQKALRPLDRLMIISFDQSWLLNTIVIDADHTRAVLAIRPGDLVRMPGKSSEWQSDGGDYLVRWAGSGFAVYRTSDGVEILPAQYTTMEAAKAAVFQAFYTTKRP